MTDRATRHRVVAGLLALFALALPVRQLSAEDVSIHWVGGEGNSLSQPPGFYGSKAALRIADTVLLYQRQNGGWPKNYNRAANLSATDRKKILGERKRTDTTIDNGSTHSEIRYLAKVYNATRDERYKQAFMTGVEFLLDAQYTNGGWPQFFPDPKGYARHITFNDGAMMGVMSALREITRDKPAYPFVDDKLRRRCEKAVAKGISCILACQIVVNGRRTAWCAQHDEKSFAPRKARSYELASLSGSESVGIVRFLMSLDTPSQDVIEAIQDAVTWFNASKLTGIREVRKVDKSTPRGFDKIVVQDAAAPPMWARFYQIGSNTPIFCSRDGKPKATLAEISYERRTGYSWLGYYPAGLLEHDYPAWQRKWAPRENVRQASPPAVSTKTSTAEETILFLGDSITAAGGYVRAIDSALKQQSPEHHPRVLNRGKSSETVSGLSEAYHPGIRPCLFARLDKELKHIKPDWIVACYGINCGIYHPFEKNRFEAYKNGMTELIERSHAAGSRLVLLTAPPYAKSGPVFPIGTDAAGRKRLLNDANEQARAEAEENPRKFGYRTPYAYYDHVMEIYATWLLTLNDREGVWVIDLRTPIVARLKETHGRDPIHPNPVGHRIMAETFLAAWPGIKREAAGSTQSNE